MIKDHTRDYATSAFRFYAQMGKPSFDGLKDKIYQDALELAKMDGIKTNNICSPTELAVMRAEQAVLEKKAELEDILAVEKTLRNMRELRGDAAKRAIEIVYFTQPDRDIEKGDIENRVIAASEELKADRATIYRWLGQARKVFCSERGLRITTRRIINISKVSTSCD